MSLRCNTAAAATAQLCCIHGALLPAQVTSGFTHRPAAVCRATELLLQVAPMLCLQERNVPGLLHL
jgi:hypothetical protein